MMRLSIIAAAVLLSACGGSNSPPPPPPPVSSAWSAGPVINGVNYSAGVVFSADGGFNFPQAAPGIHYVTRAPTSGRSGARLQFSITGDATFSEIDCGAPGCVPGLGKVRLIVQRCGDDWQGADNRYWSPPVDLQIGQGLIDYDFGPAWTNVAGAYNADGLQVTLGNLCSVGFTFGGMFAGHGSVATGSAYFIVNEYTLKSAQ